MTARLSLRIACLAALAAGPAAPRSSPPPAADCGNPLPQVLNVGLPYDGALAPDEIQGRLRAAFGARYAGFAICPDRPLQINAAIGTDYQILDWLERGAVDLGAVSALALHLLARDGVDLRVLPVPETIPWTAPRWPVWESFEVAAGGRRSRPDPAADLDRFRSGILAAARAPTQGGQGDPPADAPSSRLVLQSHLSTAGFLVPVAETHRWVEQRLMDERVAADERAALRDRFWTAFFDRVCFRLWGDRGTDAPICGSGAPGAIEIEAEPRTVEPPEPGRPATAFEAARRLRDVVVIRGEAADLVFRPGTLARATAVLPADLEALFGAASGGMADAGVPAAFRSHTTTEPYFGTRTFAFSVPEGMRLLALHQKTSGRPHLTLVLPGGGVKAAYQSRQIDELYRRGHLKNRFAGSPAGDRQPLEVERVVGTSGGALLGFFVARLGAAGPWNLSEILWQRPAGERNVPLDSSDLFSWTDLPRYASLIAILGVFGLVVGGYSLRRDGWLSPPAREVYEDAATGRPSTRGRAALLLPLLAILLVTPIFVRWVSGEPLLEHIPELEGMLFVALVVMAMFADQCMVCGPPRDAPRPRSRMPYGALGAGLALMLLPALARLRRPDIEPRTLTTGVAYLALVALAGAAVYAGRRRRLQARPSLTELAAWLAALLGGTAAAILVLRLAGTTVLVVLDRLPLLVLGLLLTLAGVGITRLVRRGTGIRSWMEERGAKLGQHAGVRAGAVALAAVLGCLAALDLTRPEALKFAATSLRDLAGAPSKLDAPLGGFMVMVGALLAVAGLLVAVPERQRHLRLVGVGKFVNAVLLLLVGLAFAVYVALALLAFLLPRAMTLFELTGVFWAGLLVASAVGSVVLLVWGYLGREGGGVSRGIADGLRYLTSRHPDAHLVSRRFVRLGALAAGGLLWWNFVVAPGLYGNRRAFTYLQAADARYVAAHRAANGGGDDASTYRLTAELLAPANALRTDGTRFVLTVPGEAPCPVIRQPLGSGVTWYTFRAVLGTAERPRNADEGPCLDLRLPEKLDVLRGFVFASGSPFPIFPAHRVQRDPEASREALVDGGYSNNTPVEAAATLGAEQVLIVNSSHPLPCGPASSGWLANLYGPLVGNALRLPGFLFERAQQLDRRSRAGLFVVSLSPTCQPRWPGLADFRASTVTRMQRAAEADLGRRITMVESWGQPRFQVSVPLGAWGDVRY